MSITLVYPSLHVSEFTSPSSTFICYLAFVHPPWASTPICDVSLLWVSWIIIMRLHADCTVLHLWGSKRVKALEVFCRWPWREVLGCVTAALSSSLSSAAPLCHRASLLLRPWRQCHPCQRRSQILTSASRSLPRGFDRNCSIGLLWEQSPDWTPSMGYMGPKNGRIFRQ